jgi:hypothetical protein
VTWRRGITCVVAGVVGVCSSGGGKSIMVVWAGDGSGRPTAVDVVGTRVDVGDVALPCCCCRGWCAVVVVGGR